MFESDEKQEEPRRKRRDFAREFKAGSAKLVLAEGKSATQVARDLDLTELALRIWGHQAKADQGEGKPGTLTTAERKELSQLRKRGRELEVELDPRRAALRALRGLAEVMSQGTSQWP